MPIPMCSHEGNVRDKVLSRETSDEFEQFFIDRLDSGVDLRHVEDSPGSDVVSNVLDAADNLVECVHFFAHIESRGVHCKVLPLVHGELDLDFLGRNIVSFGVHRMAISTSDVLQ